MNRYIALLSWMSLVVSGIFTACIDDDFTTSPSDILYFSTDTINFDTIFTDEGTSTRTLKVYNRSDKSLRISSIQLAKGAASGFVVNVDGLSGTTFDNTEIRGNDSLFIYIIANVAPTGQISPVECNDSLVFMTNGIRQDVKLLAQTQDAKRMRGVVVNSDSLITADKPIIIYDSLVVAPNVTLTIEPGAMLYFHNNATLDVYGKLCAQGTSEAIITMRGDRLDRLFDNLPYNNLAGQWGGVRFREESYNNTLTHVMLRGTTWGILCDSSDIATPTLTIHNSIIHNSTDRLLTVKCNNISITNSELSDAGTSVVSVEKGVVNLTHCTIVNYYFYDLITGATIEVPPVAEIIESGMQLSFNNCLIAGNASPLSEGDFTNSEVYFNSCLIAGVEGTDDMNFINTQWGGDPMFWLIDRENYLYDYRIGSAESDAIGWGATDFATGATATDMYGVSRNERIDVGAYQFTTNSPAYQEETEQ